MSDLTPNAIGQRWVNSRLSEHRIEDYNHPNARFFYVSFGISNGATGYASCTCITTHGAQPNRFKLERDMSDDGSYGVTLLNIQEFTKDEFTKFLSDPDAVYDNNKTYTFPATFYECPESGGFVVTFRDVPGAITQGQTFDEAVDMAQDALLTILKDESIIPTPSNISHGDVCITVTMEK